MIVINIITSISALYVYTRCGKSIGWMLRHTNSKQTSVVVGYEWCDWLLNDNCFIGFVDATGLIKFKWWNIWSLTFLNISLVEKNTWNISLFEIFYFIYISWLVIFCGVLLNSSNKFQSTRMHWAVFPVGFGYILITVDKWSSCFRKMYIHPSVCDWLTVKKVLNFKWCSFQRKIPQPF